MDHTTSLGRSLDAVRRAWRGERLLTALATLAAVVCLLLLSLAALDRVYHLDAAWRMTLLAAAVLAISGSAIVLTAPLRRRIDDERVALFIEERMPGLAGRLAAAVEATRATGVDPLRAELSAALAADCLAQTGQVHPWRLIDRRRLARRAAAGALALLVVGATVAARPGLAAHELARLLTPWIAVPLDESEAMAERREIEIESSNQQLIAEQAAARAPAAPVLTVEPGDARVRRGGSLRVLVSADRVTAPPALLMRDSAGVWRTLAMTEDPERPDHFIGELSELGVDTVYAVAMDTVRTRDFGIAVYDVAEVKRATVTLRYPAYLKAADRALAAGPIDAVAGTVAHVELEASAPLRDGRLSATGVQDVALTVQGRTAVGDFPVTASGQWTVAATGADGEPVAGIEGPWSVIARSDGPPMLELLYPQIDTVAHPMAEIAIAARAEDDVALKEVRLVWTWCEDAPGIVRRDCAGSTSRLTEFTIALEERPRVQTGDSIVFHVEAEDMKGQVASSDTYAVTIGELESTARYGPPPHPVAEHPPSPIELITLIGAMHDLDARRASMTPEQFKRESRRLATYLVEKRPRKNK